jgi:dynein heavy chain
MSANMKGMRSLCSQLLRLGEVEGLVAQAERAGAYPPDQDLASSVESLAIPDSDEMRVEALCEEVLSRLPGAPFDLELVRQQYPIARERSMNSVLTQELQRFNTLLRVIKTTLKSLKETLKGESISSEAIEQVFVSVLHGEVPTSWRKVSYPTGATLAGYVTDLRKRLAAFKKWISAGPPPVYWLPGFFSPQSFLTAILQDHARRQKLAIDTLTFAFSFEEKNALGSQDPTSDTWR